LLEIQAVGQFVLAGVPDVVGVPVLAPDQDELVRFRFPRDRDILFHSINLIVRALQRMTDSL